MTQKTEAARVIAKLLASRHTPIDEIPHLIENVERALSKLEEKAISPQPAAPSPPALATKSAQRTKRAPLARAPRETRIAMPAETSAPAAAPVPEVVEAKPVQPVLLRRAEVIHVAPLVPPTPPILVPAGGSTRGVVQWFDTRTNRGTLRLQGLSSDLPIDGEILAACGLTRLFKGQEIEATLDESGQTPKIASLKLLNLSPNSPVMGGTVRDRHAKQVVVELKREALSRAAARAEAELLLPSRRAGSGD